MPKQQVSVIKEIKITIECTCGETHIFDKEADVYTYQAQGCDSCGYGGGTNYSYTCPKSGKYVSITDYD